MANVLLVDDDADIRDTTALRLQMQGYEVTAVADADAALTATTQHTFDVAVIDIELPGTNGIELLHTIRDNDSTHQLPVIFYTAHWSAATAARGAALADAYVTKSQPVARLLESVADLVASRSQ